MYLHYTDVWQSHLSLYKANISHNGSLELSMFHAEHKMFEKINLHDCKKCVKMWKPLSKWSSNCQYL